MKKIFLFTVILICCSVSAFSQSCLPEGITFLTQEEIDNFQSNYPGCTEIEGTVAISGSDIANLNGLSVLTSIWEDLWIQSNPSLTNLTGLDNLSLVGGTFSIMNNPVMSNISGLHNLISVGLYFHLSGNDALENLEGIDNLVSIGVLGIIENDALTSLSGLDNLSSITGNLLIESNPALSSLSGLDNVSSIGGGIVIISNPSLFTLMGLNNITSIGGSIAIGENASLTSLYGIENISASTISELHIFNNSSLDSCHVQSICEYLAAPNGEINIFSNAAGCNNQTEVEDSCPGFNIEEYYKSGYVSIYPNPAYQEVNISTDDGREVEEVCIYTLTGQQVLIDRPVNGTIDISALQPGMYIVEVAVENVKLREKLIVE